MNPVSRDAPGEMTAESERPQFLYGGIAGAAMSVESFALGEGVELRQTYSHLFSANLMAFARPDAGGHHPAPWRAAKGGFGYDIEVEIRTPLQTTLGDSFSAQDTIWWVAALLRIARFPYLSVPVISNRSFRDIPDSREEPTLTPFETDGRILRPTESTACTLNPDDLAWVAAKWRPAGDLLNRNPKFYNALKAFDLATIPGRASSSMLALWGAIEDLFAPSAAEIRFRVAALLASYLQPPGQSRLELYRSLLKLYNERSIAAHTAQDVAAGPLLQTYVIMRNALLRMINETKTPTQSDLESRLFCQDLSPE